MVARLLEAGMYAEALADWTMGRKVDSALLLNFTNVASQGVAEAFGLRIRELLRD